MSQEGLSPGLNTMHQAGARAALCRVSRVNIAFWTLGTNEGSRFDDTPGSVDQAARTVSRNLPTSCLRRLESPDNDLAADSTCSEAEPVSLAPRCTSTILEETC
jgi:hypothetical protein